MKRVVVTGGAGFIGANTTKKLIERGYEVLVVDDLSFGKKSSVCSDAKFLQCSVINYELLSESFQGVDAVVHLAAWRSVAQSVEKPIEVNLNNTTGTLTVLEAAKNNGVKKVIVASSSSVYGGSDILPTPESAPLRPKSPYAASKVAGEYYCQVYSYLYDITTVCFRFFNIYGPLQDPESPYAAVIPLFMKALWENKPIEIHGDGKQSRDFTFINDAVDAIVACLETNNEIIKGKAYNIGAGQPHSILKIAEIIAELFSVKPNIVHVAPRVGDVRHSYADVKAAKADFGYEPKWSIEDGLKETYKWFIENVSYNKT